MSEKITFRTIWHSAGISGIVLAAVSSAYFILSQWLQPFADQKWASILLFVADLAKIVACIWLLRLYLHRFRKDFPSAIRSDLRKLGTMIALLSSLVFAAVCMAYYNWHPEIVSQTFSTISSSLQGIMDSNTRQMLEHYEENFVKIIFFSQFIYCFFIGWILTCILTPRIIGDNPFDSPEEESSTDENLFE